MGHYRRFVTWADEHPVALWLRSCALVIGGAVAMTAGIAGCSSSGEQAVAAGIPTAAVTQVQVLPVAVGYGNVLTACHGTTRLYLADLAAGYSGPPLAVVANDPTCLAVPA